MNSSLFRIRSAAIALLAGLAIVRSWGQETDARLGADNPHGWGFFQAKVRDSALPNVLLMGDSILGGYRGTVISRLRGKANVDVFLNPYHQASKELYPELGAALAKGAPYAVIHFNMGLHGWAKGRIPEGQFEPLTRKLVEFLRGRSPAAELIWASTTPVTVKGQPGFLDEAINPIIVEQNRLAAGIMGRESVPIDDLYGLMLGHLALARGDQFHWTPPGSELQGVAVAGVILARLPAGRSGAGLNFFIAPQGDDANEGSEAHPFATLERARTAVRQALKAGGQGLSEGGVTVNLRGGTYLREQTFQLGAEDSGDGKIPVTYRSFPGETARLVGGKPLRAAWFAPVGNRSPIWGRLQEAARGHVLEISLPEHGISDFGLLRERGMHEAGAGAMELFVNAHPLPLAQWPKADSAPLQGMGVGFSLIEKVLSPKAFVVPGDEIGRWAHADQAWFHGYWGNLWADYHLPAASIDVASRTVTLAEAPHYPMKAGQPFRIYNLLEEITEPGDWFLDRTTGKLYVWPTADWPTAEIFVSTLPGDLIAMKNTRGLVLDRLVLEMSWSRLLNLEGGSHNVVRNCVLRDAGTDGASIDGSDNGLSGCVIEDTGECGVRLFGGSRAQLEPGRNYIRESRLTRFSRWTWTYTPGIEIHGDGQIVANNLIADAPHSAILFFGNDHLIELNEIRDVCLFSSDAGAIYAGRRWDFRGTKIIHNFIHDVHSPLEGPGVGDNGVYLDDALSGTLVSGNIFYKIKGDAIFCNGGRDNIMEGNVIVGCGAALEISAFGVKHATGWHLLERLSEEGVHYRAEPWATAYPGLAAIPADRAQITAPGALWLYPEGSRFERNLGFGNRVFIKKSNWGDPATFARVLALDVKSNVENRAPRFQDEAELHLALRPDSTVFDIPGFARIPFEAIGPQAEKSADQ